MFYCSTPPKEGLDDRRSTSQDRRDQSHDRRSVTSQDRRSTSQDRGRRTSSREPGDTKNVILASGLTGDPVVDSLNIEELRELAGFKNDPVLRNYVCLQSF